MKLFDWFTVLAQIAKFVVLIFLLKHFLYGRILRAIDSRVGAIKGRLAEAEQKANEAELQKLAYEKKLSELEAARDEMLAEAQRDADRRRTIEQTLRERALGPVNVVFEKAESLGCRLRASSGGGPAGTQACYSSMLADRR